MRAITSEKNKATSSAALQVSAPSHIERLWRPAAVALWASLSSLLLLTGCDDWLPGKPNPAAKWVPPATVVDFDQLYAENCAACHAGGSGLAAAMPMNDPLYLAWASDADLRKAIADGVPGTAMPPFAISQGGPLTDEQIAILVKGMRQRWAKPLANAGVALPPYAAPLGDPAAGAQVFAVQCASCHGADGRGGTAKGSIVDPNYLALVSDQGLRTTIVAGRPDLEMPNFLQTPSGRPLTPEEIADLVAWLASHRRPTFSPRGQTASAASSSSPALSAP